MARGSLLSQLQHAQRRLRHRRACLQLQPFPYLLHFHRIPLHRTPPQPTRNLLQARQRFTIHQLVSLLVLELLHFLKDPARFHLYLTIIRRSLRTRRRTISARARPSSRHLPPSQAWPRAAKDMTTCTVIMMLGFLQHPLLLCRTRRPRALSVWPPAGPRHPLLHVLEMMLLNGAPLHHPPSFSRIWFGSASRLPLWPHLFLHDLLALVVLIFLMQVLFLLEEMLHVSHFLHNLCFIMVMLTRRRLSWRGGAQALVPGLSVIPLLPDLMTKSITLPATSPQSTMPSPRHSLTRCPSWPISQLGCRL